MDLPRVFILAALLGQTACSSLFFFPGRQMERTPGDLGVDYEDVLFESGDGITLHGWYLPARGTSRGTVLFLHGNAENISTHLFSVVWLPWKGFDVFLFDYRGYGRSAGRPSLSGVREDFDAALRWLLGRRPAGDRGVVVLGQSIGGAIAVYGVAHSEARDHILGLVVESAPSSYRGIAREKLAAFSLTWPFQWPLSLAFSDRYSPLGAIGEVAPIPVLIIHGDRDPIVPLHHGERLFEAAAPPKEFWLVEGGAHIQAFAVEAFRQRLADHLDGLYGSSAPGAPQPAPPP